MHRSEDVTEIGQLLRYYAVETRGDEESHEGLADKPLVHAMLVMNATPDVTLLRGRSSWVVGKYRLRVLALVVCFDENLWCERFG